MRFCTRKGTAFLLSLLALLLITALPGDGLAFNLDFGNGAGMDCDVTVSYGASWRTRGPDAQALENINKDDGDRNFDKHAMITNRFTSIADIDIYYQDYGLFMRPKAFYDFAYDNSNDNDSPGTMNNSYQNGGDTKYDDFTDETQDAHRDKIEMLDLFVYGTHSFSKVDTMFRIGRQAVNWGESLFILQGINGATAYLDTTQANVPGVEVKELLMPSEQFYTEITVGDFTLCGFYQWRWHKNRLDESGSFFNTADFLDDAGQRMLVQVAPGINATVDSVGDDEAKNSGEWGVALRYIAPMLNDTEFGIYFVNYHEKMPMLKENLMQGGTPSPVMKAVGGNWANLPVAPGYTLGDVNPAAAAKLNFVDLSSYYLEYAENVRMIGFSFSTILGDTNVAGEISYRYDAPVAYAPDPGAISIVGAKYERSDYWQAQISTISILPQTFLYDNASLTTEIGMNHICDGDTMMDGYNHTAYGGVFKLSCDYYQLMQELDLTVPVTFKWFPKGTSPILGTFAEKADSVGISFDFTYKSVYKVSLGYVNFLHDPKKNPKSDRDYVSLNLKYTF